ncbi:PAS domain S-box protein [Gracilimonas mengyeensis]|uniref:PAS domain S-box-containing protein n=1 Tax=Gracilimonas mengyeensis TaxID=1302730 RepID=A0A521CFL0_9BACT|nr:PAS domain S-box protein [Gracilimonas mengyeensis]SMO58233.1 PAS domain S-box-containing protein [Gracilimonas mengyeensis]
MVRQDDIYTVIELDPLSRVILNSLNAHVAIIDTEGLVVAFNKKWKAFSDELQESWSHPYLDENILTCLQAPLASGSDSALRLLLGLKEVLNGESESFTAKINLSQENQQHWFSVTINTTGLDSGAVLVYEDISNQTISRQYLRETREKLAKYFQNNLYGILVADDNEVIIEANDEACKLLEISLHDITYSNISSYLDVEVDAGEIQKKINREGNYIGEHVLKTANGTEVPIELSVILFRNETGKPVTSWVFKDITNKKITEQALKESEQQYKLQFNNTLEGTIIGRPNGRILAVNPAACDLLGYTEEELVNKERDIIFDVKHPENCEALKQRRKNGEFTGEVFFTHKEGYTIPVEVSSVIFEAEDGTEKTIVSIKDISERKAIEQQLMQEKEFTESAISSLPSSFFVFKSTGELIRWNTMLENDFGYNADELENLNILELVHPEDRESIKFFLNRGFTGERVNLETRCVSKEGRVLHYLISGTSFFQNGEHFIVGSGLNQNDFKEIENERNRNAQLLTQLFDNSPIGIVLIDAKGKVKELNESFEQLFGYTNDELVGVELDETIVPSSMSMQAKTLSELSFTGDAFQTETIRRTKEGKEIPVLVGGVPVELDGEVIAIFGMYVDISERKRLENQIVELLETEKKARLHMQDMFEEAPSAIATLEGKNHTYTFANDRYKELVGRDELIGNSIAEVIPEFSDQGFLELLDICYREGKPFHFTEKKIYFNNEETGEKTVHYLNFVVKPLHDELQNIYGVIIEAIDVSEQVEARKIIEESLAEKETLLNEVHHRVKNNLAIVSGLLELEMFGSTDEKVSQHLQSSQSRISTIAKVHELLYQNASLSHVNFKKFIESVMIDQSKLPGYKAHEIISEIKIDDVVLNVNQAVPAGMLLNELLSCIEDELEGDITKHENRLSLVMKDLGSCIQINITDHFGGNLFRSFADTNLMEKQLRMELIHVLLKQIDGELTIDDKEKPTLTVSFAKREIKGPHSGLN